MARIAENIADPLFQKMRYKKDIDGYGDKNWSEWFRYLTREVSLDRTVGELLGDATRDNLAKLWMENCAQNMSAILSGHKLWELPKLTTPALVVGAGPSIWAKKHLELLNEWISDDIHRRTLVTIFSTDRMLVPLLKYGIAPDYVVSVDGNREKIAYWYEDPLVKPCGPLKAILAATVAPNVVETCKKNNVTPYFFVAMLDQFMLTNNITRLMHYMTGATAVACGGNAGSACWGLAYYLEAKTVALIGLDYGYLKGTPIEETAYYNTLKTQAKNTNEILALYFNDLNPDFNLECYSDIMFGHYRQGFMEMLELASEGPRPIETINCTEGGLLHGGKIRGMQFADWLKSLEKPLEAPQIAA